MKSRWPPPPVCETFSQNRFFLNDGFPKCFFLIQIYVWQPFERKKLATQLSWKLFRVRLKRLNWSSWWLRKESGAVPSQRSRSILNQIQTAHRPSQCMKPDPRNWQSKIERIAENTKCCCGSAFSMVNSMQILWSRRCQLYKIRSGEIERILKTRNAFL